MIFSAKIVVICENCRIYINKQYIIEQTLGSRIWFILKPMCFKEIKYENKILLNKQNRGRFEMK